MKKKTRDWLLSKTMPERREMFGNVRNKIEDYRIPFDLTESWITSVVLLCDTFTIPYDAVVENRATAAQMETWFDNLQKAQTENAPAPVPPVFSAITLPVGAMDGIYKSFRKKMDFFKSNENYTRADGENLMIVAPEGTASDVELAEPELSASVNASGVVSVKYVREEFSGLELQWRVAGSELWQLADKSSETVVSFTPPGIVPPVKIELRGIYLLKNQRVGTWSPIYPLTVS